MDKYEEIMRCMEKKTINNEAIQDQKASLNKTFWENVKKYNMAKGNIDFLKNSSTYSLIEITNKIAVSGYMDNQNEHVEEEIQGLQEHFYQSKLKNETYGNNFYKFMEQLIEKFSNLEDTFNTTNTSNEIINVNKQTELYKDEIKRLSKEMEENKFNLRETEFVELDDFSLQSIWAHLKNESLKRYGDPNKFPKRLNEIKNNIDVLKAKVHAIREKILY